MGSGYVEEGHAERNVEMSKLSLLTFPSASFLATLLM